MTSHNPDSMDIEQALRQAVARHQAGALHEAEELYRTILRIDPRHPDANHNLGVMALQTGHPAHGVPHFQIALEAAPGVRQYWLSAIDALMRAGGFEQARALMHQGRATGLIADAVDALEERLKRLTSAEHALIALYQQDRMPEMEALAGGTVAVEPDFGFGWKALALARQRLGREEEAFEAMCHAARLLPADAEVHANLGILLRGRGRVAEAEAAFRESIRLHPDGVEAHGALGFLLYDLERVEEAEAAFREVIRLAPDNAQAHANLGVLLNGRKRFVEAEACLREAMRLAPDLPDLHLNLGLVLGGNWRCREAWVHLQRALELQEDFHLARWILAIARLPVHYLSCDEITRTRRAYGRALADLTARYSPDRMDPAVTFPLIGAIQPFHLAYQSRSDRFLQRGYGRLACAIMAAWLERQAPPPAPLPPARPDGRLRVGIVSGYFQRHPVWLVVVKGLVRHVDRSRFLLYGYHTTSECDDETRNAKRWFDGFRQGPFSLERWVQTIREDRLDLLFYPEIGMDPMTHRLACLRLVPVQVTSWGHPSTSGFPTMDFFLSGALLESANGDDHYTERLVRLPNTGCCWLPDGLFHPPYPFEPPGAADAVRLMSCGKSFKNLPRYDWVYPYLARQLGNCVFIFFHQEKFTNNPFRERLGRAFAAEGLHMDDYCHFLPWLPKSYFLNLLKRMDVCLDTMPFSGFTTAMEILEYGVPLVTLEGNLMRNRLAAAVLRRMGITETIAGSAEEYVSIVLELARDPERRQALRERILSRYSLVCEDLSVVRAFEAFVERAVVPE
ncbi:MAG: tetratricopeptide repeat protein [Magnetococcales bacterium]|nr:tetratricopeptide repeat protein [Magnetococcales bacterium]